MRYVLRRLVYSLFQLAIVSSATFFMFRVAPADFYSLELDNPQRRAASTATERKAHGLDRPWEAQYMDWVQSSLRGDFGQSLAYELPVRRLLAPRILKTLTVAVPALLLAWILGIGAAIFGVRTRVAATLDPSAAAAAMIPDVIAVSLLLWLAVAVGLRIDTPWLPIASLTGAIAPVIFLHASGELRHALDLEFVRIAQARGIRGWQLWLKYVLPAAANPLISLAGLSAASAVGSSFLVEALTGWPGVGPLFLEAVQSRDYPIVQTMLTGLSAVLILGNFVADIAIYRLDPRIRVI